MERPAIVADPADAPRWAALSARRTPAWFDETRLGIFVHWGAYSVAGWAEPIGELGTIDESTWFPHNPYAEWLYNTMRIEGSPAQRHMSESFPGLGYDDLLDRWQAPTVDYDALLGSFHAAGAGYVVLTTKHHDGITLWDAPGTDGRNTMRRGPRSDLVAAYADAARTQGLRFGAYYSGGLDWHVRPFPPHTTHASVFGDRPNDPGYASYAAAHVRDLIARYAPDVLWNDINWPDSGKGFDVDGLGRVFEEYYAAVPEGIVNDRWHVPHADYRTSEYQFMLDSEGGVAWENCRGIGFSFGYNANEAQASLDSRGVIRHLVDVATRGGHLLLGVGPRADGTLPEFQAAVLRDMAIWMQAAGPILGGMQPVSGAQPAELIGDGYLRMGTSGGETYCFVDADGAMVGLRTASRFELLTPGFADLAVEGDTVTVRLHQHRPGAAVLRVLH